MGSNMKWKEQILSMTNSIRKIINMIKKLRDILSQKINLLETRRTNHFIWNNRLGRVL